MRSPKPSLKAIVEAARAGNFPLAEGDPLLQPLTEDELDRAAYWRNASPEEHSRVLRELLNAADAFGTRWPKPPLGRSLKERVLTKNLDP